MPEDLFKTLYKSHRRIGLQNLNNVLDPHTSDATACIGDYSVCKIDDTWVCEALPGLSIWPNKLSITQQRQLINESLGTFLKSPEHLSNLDAHYSLERPINLFDTKLSAASRLPSEKTNVYTRDKIRWVTLGGQYNWTSKKYPSYEPGTPGCPLFPESLTKNICQEYGIKPEAAIVNFYSEGDILSPHQDVAELANHDLVSISLGCTCIFYISLKRHNSRPLPILLRSGDVVIMGGQSRFAFHGVGRVFSGSTPEVLCENGEIEDKNYHDWLKNHRININVRQMKS